MKMLYKYYIDFNNSLNNLAIVLNDIPFFIREFHCVMSLENVRIYFIRGYSHGPILIFY